MIKTNTYTSRRIPRRNMIGSNFYHLRTLILSANQQLAISLRILLATVRYYMETRYNRAAKTTANPT